MDDRISAHGPEPTGARRPIVDDDDVNPYGVGDAHPNCPACDAALTDRNDLCQVCGWEYQPPIENVPIVPVRCQWEASPALHVRMAVFTAYVAGLVGFTFLLGRWDETPVELGLTVLIFSGLAAYVLGTFDRVDLTRNNQGKVSLSRTWRFCFVPLGARKISRKGIESIVLTQDDEHSAFDLAILIVMLTLAILPGVLWWILVFNKSVHQVALAKDHGRPEVILYRGISKQHAKEIATTVSEVCKYRVIDQF